MTRNPMRAVIQRVNRAHVTVDGKSVSHIDNGLMILLGVEKGDTAKQAERLANKCARLRIFDDNEGRFNLSLLDVKGEALVVSQFTLLADTTRGRRPSFVAAETPEEAQRLYEHFANSLSNLGITTRCGVFGESMVVSLENRGPVTIVLEE